MILLLTIPLLIFGYHYLRNGWPVNKLFSFGDFFARMMWCTTFLGAYFLTTGGFSWLGALLFLLCYLEILVPHGIGMDMGRHPEFQNKWPTFFIKVEQSTWELWPLWKRELVDVAQMFVIGLIRGLIVFAPLFFFNLPNLGWAIATQALWQPASYYLGYRIPYQVLRNAANSSEWGEFLVGIGWAVSLYQVFEG